MAQKKEASAPKASESGNVQAILTRSARGASFLISLQICSRALTFIINQIVVRFLSPELIGISSQLELYAVSVLTFARESIRVALGRSGQLGKEEQKNGPGKQTESYAVARKAQEAINLSYIAVAMGVPIAAFFSWLYWRNPKPAVLAMPYIKESFAIYTAATILELCMEPAFAVAAQQTLFSTRGVAEASATFSRCIVYCGLAMYSSREGLGLGALPVAAGQFTYAAVLNLVYYTHIYPRSWREGYSLVFRKIQANSSTLIASRLPRRHFTLALNLYAQSGLKYILTQGDSILITMFKSLESQGVYALASGYGSLLARMLFQPIEESSRGVFGGLCSSVPPSATPDKPHPNLLTAHRYLTTVLRLYSLLSSLLLFVAPFLLPPLLPLLAGSRFAASSGAPQVLGLYAYYLPFLAFNGLLEAFVAAVAIPTELQTQAGYMTALTVGIVGVGWTVLSVMDKGVEGLISVNCINMGMRIIWSSTFVKRYFKERGVSFTLGQVLPRNLVTGLGVAVMAILATSSKGPDGGFWEVAKVVGIGGVYGLALLYLERAFLMECYELLRPSHTKRSDHDTKKEL